MTLIKCPDCNVQMSDKASACPSCGQHLGLWTKIKNITVNDNIQIGILFVLFLTAIVLALNLMSFKDQLKITQDQLKITQDQLKVAQERLSLSLVLNRPIVGVMLVDVKEASRGPLERDAKNNAKQKADVFDINYTIMNSGKYIATNVSLSVLCERGKLVKANGGEKFVSQGVLRGSEEKGPPINVVLPQQQITFHMYFNKDQFDEYVQAHKELFLLLTISIEYKGLEKDTVEKYSCKYLISRWLTDRDVFEATLVESDHSITKIKPDAM